MKIYRLAEYIFDPTDPEASNDTSNTGSPETLNFGEKGQVHTSEVLRKISSVLPERITSWFVADGTVGWYKFSDGVVYEVSVSPAAHGR
jgi:hypothetical protein